MRILLVEDEPALAQRVTANLARHGMTCEWLSNAEDALDFASDGFTVLVVDVGLPGMSGIDLVRALRARSLATPILILTARSSWEEKVEGLNAGADDFIVKPVRTEELVARLHALARRAFGHSATRIAVGAIAIDTASSEAWLDDAPLALTASEFRLLQMLAYRAGRTLTRQTILDNLYSLASERDENAIEVLVGRLRRKIGRERIVTVRGLGYRLEA
ncbi:response regulator transcription factor [Sphingobium lignivorans]|uniref:DNA-binding response OmpR family regulator n=1 Tax=Sphingobium lignivorans TaxID=2735886 RepID=A0ABR6NBZ6_9SPHN|nr:response regulator transcription factor [Sphingobium lignivorans]MBB5984800.1 DNA-binding response OmpR family regulator [Sphingobium lignivorans]